MISKELISPHTIAVIGASNDLLTPGGSLVKNLVMNNYQGNIFAVSATSDNVQGIKAYRHLVDIPDVDMAFIAEDNGNTLASIETLCQKKSCKAIVVFPDTVSSPVMDNAQALERTRQICNTFGTTLVGPNSSGIALDTYCGLYTKASIKKGGNVEIISSSRTTISYMVESAPRYGLNISGIYSVGYSPLTTVEDILEWMDQNWDEYGSPNKVIAIYIERISDSARMMACCRSLISKGAGIVGVLASHNKVVASLFKKCGVVRASGRDELINIVSILAKGRPEGRRIAILTQAGGPAVMLRDMLTRKGVEVPYMFFEDYSFGKTAGQISSLIDSMDQNPDIDGTVVIFGLKEMSDSSEVSNVIFRKVRQTEKPLYPLFTSESSYQEYITEFHNQGGITFTDEVVFAQALANVITTPPASVEGSSPAIDKYLIKRTIDESPEGWMPPFMVQQILDASGINRIRQIVALTEDEAVEAAISIGYPVVMKVVGPLHKTEVDGVSLNIADEHTLRSEYQRMVNIEGVTGFILQPMIDSHIIELQISAVREPNFSPLISCSLGGIFSDAMEDISYCMAPVSSEEAETMITSLKAYPIIGGYRGQEGVNQVLFGDLIRRVSALCMSTPQIVEMELNPVFGDERDVTVIGARIRIEK
ncbi:MAG: acetate--CoA ligase family protein [Bacteroidales bacterium]|nr:acetate--CoA ligase family protein [Bacteroidales bacterium]